MRTRRWGPCTQPPPYVSTARPLPLHSMPPPASLSILRTPFSHVQYGRTALHWAATKGHLEVAAALMAAGCDKEAKCKVRRPPTLPGRAGPLIDRCAISTVRYYVTCYKPILSLCQNKCPFPTAIFMALTTPPLTKNDRVIFTYSSPLEP